MVREFASEKLSDTYAPATGCHTLALIPLIYFKMLGDEPDEHAVMALITRRHLLTGHLGHSFRCPKTKSLGPSSTTPNTWSYAPTRAAGACYWHFRNYVSETLDCCWCNTGRCTVDGVHNTSMIHLDDLLFAGSYDFWINKFLPAMTLKFSLSCNELKDVGSSRCFLKMKLIKLSDGLMVVPGTTTERVVVCFERSFGPARALSIPNADTSQHLTTSQLLTTADGRAYRSVIGLPLYLARERMDVMFAVTELATCMFGATLCVLQRLRKVIGYLKTSGDVGVKLVVPQAGSGKWKSGGEQFWPVETFRKMEVRRRTVLACGDVCRCRLVSEQAAQKIYQQCHSLCQRKICLRFFKEPACCVPSLS